MSAILLDAGIRSQILHIIASVGQCKIPIKTNHHCLQLENSSIAGFNGIVAYVATNSSVKLIPENMESATFELLDRALNAAESNNIIALIEELNNVLLLKSYLVAHQLSVADIGTFVCIYSTYAKLDKNKMYFDYPNVTRWFDLIQNRISKSGVLPKLNIQHEPPKAPEKAATKPKKEKNKEESKEESKEEKKDSKESKKGKNKKEKKGGIKLNDHLEEIEFIRERIALFDKLYEEQTKAHEGMAKPIRITLPNGDSVEGVAFKTTPYDIAKGISIGLAKKAIVARVNDKLYDLVRPLEEDCKLEILTFDDNEGKHVFWHSSAHVLGQSLERLFKGHLTVGPALDPSQMLHNGGFYYDVDTSSIGDEANVSEHHYAAIEEFIKQITKDKQPFQRVVLTKDQALEMFKSNKYKQELISEKIPDGANCTAYRCGPLIDLCKGPHVPNTDVIKALKLVKNGATYWRNDKNRESLQRIYGISFPDNKMMKEYEEHRKLAEENDHRKIGQDQKLFFFHDLSPGSCFWLPHGARIYNKLQQFISNCYRNRGFTEVISPNVYNFKLWEISGHAQNYADNMFLFDVEEQQFGLKPMNCPGHCLMFKSELRSYRDLPLRFADFGALHRNELSGGLTGLTRVRRFQQDDAHIFCRRDQIHQEVTQALDFLDYVYGKFGFRFELALSTRPLEKFLGEVEVWNEAEAMLAKALDDFVSKHQTIKAWKYNHGDGAFYGPKVDIHVYDSLHRQHQCATIQLDFQLPIRFELDFKVEGGKSERPVIVHRAIYGSFERFIGILSEHLAGKWPFWLSPRQACVIPVSNEYNEYAHKVRDLVHKAGYWIDVDDSRNHLPKKIRNAQVSQYNFILVVGEKERESNSVNVRRRDNTEHGAKTIEELLQWFQELTEKFE